MVLVLFATVQADNHEQPRELGDFDAEELLADKEVVTVEEFLSALDPNEGPITLPGVGEDDVRGVGGDIETCVTARDESIVGEVDDVAFAADG